MSKNVSFLNIVFIKNFWIKYILLEEAFVYDIFFYFRGHWSLCRAVQKYGSNHCHTIEGKFKLFK